MPQDILGNSSGVNWVTRLVTCPVGIRMRNGRGRGLGLVATKITGTGWMGKWKHRLICVCQSIRRQINVCENLRDRMTQTNVYCWKCLEEKNESHSGTLSKPHSITWQSLPFSKEQIGVSDSFNHFNFIFNEALLVSTKECEDWRNDHEVNESAKPFKEQNER